MKHVSDIDVIELAANRLPAERRGAVEAHLAECPECRERSAAARRVWQVLGDWEVAARGRDLSAGVLVAARGEDKGRSPRHLWRRRASAAMRVAAAIALGAGVGHLAARHARSPAGVPDGAVATVEVARDAAARALAMPVFEQAAPAGLAEAVLGAEASVEEEAS